jgi:phosphotransacetylase
MFGFLTLLIVIKAAAQMDYEGDVQTIFLGKAEEINAKVEALGFKNFAAKTIIIDPVQDSRQNQFADELHVLRTKSARQQLLRDSNYLPVCSFAQRPQKLLLVGSSSHMSRV